MVWGPQNLCYEHLYITYPAVWYDWAANFCNQIFVGGPECPLVEMTGTV
jgi:hypothetical protein